MAQIIFDSEKEIEDFFIDFNSRHGYCHITQERYHSYDRQVRIGRYGIADIVAISYDIYRNKVNVKIIEIKKHKVCKKSISQVMRYVAGFRHMLNSCNINHDVSAILVAPDVATDDSTVYLYGSINDLEIYKINACLEQGLSVDYFPDNWHIKSPDFDGLGDSMSGLCCDIGAMYSQFLTGKIETTFDDKFMEDLE